MLFKKILAISLSIFIGLLISEIALRIKHSISLDYDVEMWRYAKYLKVKNNNPKINHTHRVNSSANLQGVDIKINNFGQRDVDYDNSTLKKYDRSFLFLGSSITLGWGVDNKDTYLQLLNSKAKKNNKNWFFVNGGIGNYNTERYVNNYFVNWSVLDFTDIVINFFVNDTEIINQKETNFFIKNTHLGIAFWKLINSLKSYSNQESLVNYYKNKFEDDYEGFQIAKQELLKLIAYCEQKGIKVHLILIPDIHKTNPYPLQFINKKISNFAEENEVDYIDLLDSISQIENFRLWNKYNDPHPNILAHSLYAQYIYEFLNK